MFDCISKMRLSTFTVLSVIFCPCLSEKVSNCSPMGLDENQIALCNSMDLRISTWDDCNSKEIWPPNTLVEIRCREGWKPREDSSTNNITGVCSSDNGATSPRGIDWLRERYTLKCQEDCGWFDSVADFSGVNLVWYASIAIFTEDFVGSGNFSQTCTGTFISSRHILTAAQCLQYSFQRRTVFLRPEDIRIRTGHFYSSALNIGNSQYHRIEKVVFHEDFKPNNFESDVAIIVLKNPIERTRYVHPICISTPEEDSVEGTFGRFVTYNIENSAYQKPLKRISSRKCRESNPAHSNLDRGTMLCGSVQADPSEPCTHYAGTGYVNVASNFSRLRGVRSGLSFSCNEPIVFTRLSRFTNWIHNHIYGIPKSTATKINPKSGAKEITGDDASDDHPPPLDNQPNALSIQKPRTQSNGISTESNRPRQRQPTPATPNTNNKNRVHTTPTTTSATTKKTQKPELPRAQRVCPALEPSEGASIRCRDWRGNGDCNDGGVLGSIATYQCQKFYSPAFGFDSIQRNCGESGHWRPSAEFGCILNCGVSTATKSAFIVNGLISDRVTWPWHATMFSNTSDVLWSYRCGGALISKNVILTAAHCVTHKGSTSVMEEKDLLVVLGAKSGDIFENIGDPVAKIFNVQKIVIPETYNAVTFNSDIALIQLSGEVELSDYITPVCWPSRRNADHRLLERIHLEYSTTIKGYAIGLGIDENGKLGQGLKEAALPYVTAQSCREALDRTPTDSQFCAGYLNGTSVCNGDSGGGLYFADTTQTQVKYIIQGIISNGDVNNDPTRAWRYCNNNNYAVFTRVINFSEWIHYFLDSIEDNQRKRSINK